MYKDFVFELDSELELSNPEFGDTLHTNKYNSNLAKNSLFPSDYILALFSRLAYNDEFNCLPDDWKLLTTARNLKKLNSYFGVALWNPILCQIVVAHRGTKDYNVGAIINDFHLGLRKEFYTSQLRSAATFLYRMGDTIKKKNINGPIFQLSITGHSLGAWLAQMTTFTVKYFKMENNRFLEDKEYTKNLHAHTVVYESPGCRETLLKLVESYVPTYMQRKFGNFDRLDMSVYVSKLNPINSINRHVGTVYQVNAKTHAIKEIVNLFNYKTHKIEKKHVLYFKSGFKYSLKRLFINHILPFTLREQQPDIEDVVDTECSLNVFNEDEFGFVIDWNHAIKRGFRKVLEFQEKKSIPVFDVNEEFNKLIGEDLNKTIACIRHLQPNQDMVLNLLKEDAYDEVYWEILKMEIEHFHNHILKSNRYYFKDKYRLKDFFLNEDQNILYIHVDSSSEIGYQVEASFVYNVIMFYNKTDPSLLEDYFRTDTGKHCFINWSQLNKIKKYLTSIIGKSREKVNLIIVECLDEDNEDFDSALELLTGAKKVIVISTEKKTWIEDRNAIETSGFGDNLKFQDLTEESQRELRKQENLTLYDRKMSLNDIIMEESFQDEEVYESLNKDVFLLLKFVFVPSIVPVVLDCNYNNSMENVIYLDLPDYEINITSVLSNCSDVRHLYMIVDKENCKILENIDKLNIRIYNSLEFEKECMENLDKIVYLFKIKSNKLYLTRIFNEDFYVSRNIICNRTVDPDLFNISNQKLGLYFFYGNKDAYDTLLSHLEKDQKDCYTFYSTEERAREKAVEKKLEKKSTIHLFKIEDDKIEWLDTLGNIKALKKFIKPNKASLKETDITNQRIIILSGEPGMGKSTSVAYLFLLLKSTHWVFAVSLRHCNFNNIRDQEDENRKNHSKINFDSVAKFLLKNSSASDTDFNQYLLSYCLKNKTKLKVYLLFDGYDEILNKDNRHIFIDLMEFLKVQSTAQILITTRKFRCEELENGLSVFACTYDAIDYERRILEFCSIFWRLSEDTIDINGIKSHIQRMLTDAKTTFGETITSFIGIPLQIRMITEVIASLDPHRILEITMENTLSLYQKYTEVHYYIYFRRNGIFNSKVEEWLTKCIFEELCKLAVTEIFDLKKNFIDYSDVDELNKVGIIQSEYEYNNITFTFLHDSVRDFFVSKLLKLWLECRSTTVHYDWNLEEFIVSDFLLKGEYKEMRYFVNCYLKNIEISEGRLETCRNKLLELLKKQPDLLLNIENQESVFHVCINEGLYFLIKYFLLNIMDDISNKKKLLSSRNPEYETPLYLALRKPADNINTSENILVALLEEIDKWESSDINLVFLSTLFTYFITINDIERINKLSRKYSMQAVNTSIEYVEKYFKHISTFLQACLLNNSEDVDSVLNKFSRDTIAREYLLLTTDKEKNSCLHLTSDVKIVKQLVRRGCFVNQRNAYKVTPLMVAARNGNEATVKYLLSREVEYLSTDWKGRSPVYHAVEGNHTKLISLFRHKGFDINIPDQFGTTPLLLSIVLRQDPMTICLLDNGADVNIGNVRNVFPLRLLIAMKKDTIIKKILKEEIIAIKGGGTINRAAARTEFLADKELEYIRDLIEKTE